MDEHKVACHKGIAEHCKTVIGENYSDYLDHLNELVVNKEKSWGNTLIPGYRDNLDTRIPCISR